MAIVIPTTCTLIGRSTDPLARCLLENLLESMRWDVILADPAGSRDDTSAAAEAAETESPFENRRIVDVRSRSQLREVIRGSTVVFLMDIAEPCPVDLYFSYMAVVQGTKNIVSVCKECKVERLVYNSSADVVFDGLHDIHNGNESLPYPHKFEDIMNDFKAQAEAIVLSANGDGCLLTCALRPSNVFGPMDVHLVRCVVDEAKSGRFKFILGSDKTLVDFTYVQNVAHAHILAERALRYETSVAGKSFFITNLESSNIWEFLSFILEGLGYQRPQVRLPVKLILFIVTLMECVFGTLHLKPQSFYTPAKIHTLTCTRTFDCSKAKSLLHYSPVVSLNDGISLTIQSFINSGSANSLCRREYRKSKANNFLGGGQVAEILLWRDEKKTFLYLLGLFFLFQWFLMSGSTCITSLAKLSMLLTVVLFIHGHLPSSIYGFPIEKIPSTYFEISETFVENMIKFLATIWNQSICILRSIAEGDDTRIFLKVTCSLYLLTLILRVSLAKLVGVGLVSMFTIFIVYEQQEAELDSLMMIAAAALMKSRNTVVRILSRYVEQYKTSGSVHC